MSQQVHRLTVEGATATDPALIAVRALVAATARPTAVFDAGGACVTANRAYILRATRLARASKPPAGCEGRSSFSPDGVRRWFLVSAPEDDAQPAVADFLDTVANALPVMFNAKDTQSRYLFMNRYQAELHGVTTDAAVGRTTDDLMGTDSGAFAREIDAEVIRTGRPTPFFEENFAGVDGVARRWLSSKVPLANPNGTVWGVATVAIDITVRTRLEEGLRQARQQAEDAHRAKSGFLAAMSHELRTPLNAVIGFAEIMHQQVLGPIGTAEYRDYAGHILRSGQHLLALINDVLDYARIESGSLRLNLVVVEMRGLLRGTLELLAAPAGEAGVTLASDLDGEPIVIRADEQRLRQVLLNVAGNAVKFTPAGGRVAVAVAPGPDGGAVITVTDSGIGIDEAQVARAFEPFWQADSGLDRVKEGAGIGLPLARELVALHGGRLELQSRVGEGTQITITLPDAPDERKAAGSPRLGD